MSGTRHVVTVVGARPQFVKASVVSRALAERGVREDIVHTGQHFDDEMSAIFFDELDIKQPARDLGIAGGSHGAMTGRMLEAIETSISDLGPDWVLVYGDTNSTLAGALAAAKLHVPVAHVEAGLRSFNRQMPEEINRVVTDHVSDLLFAPTSVAVENLAGEGIAGQNVIVTGDVMYDAALFFAERAACRSTVLTSLGLEEGPFVLATIHRAENTDDPRRLRAVFTGLIEVASSVPVVVPLHPRTAAALEREQLLDEVRRALVALDPVGYLDMVALERAASVIATDSGGVQKEAFFYRVPCVTLRDETEWVELVELGWNTVVPPRSRRAVEKAVVEALSSRPAEPALSPFGDGRAAHVVASALVASR